MKNYKNNVYDGAYWATTTQIDVFSAEEKLASDNDITERLAKIPTRLKAFSTKDQAHLINWGYALADASIRSFVNADYKKPKALPLSEYPLS